jgi:hypothetical protein
VGGKKDSKREGKAIPMWWGASDNH